MSDGTPGDGSDELVPATLFPDDASRAIQADMTQEIERLRPGADWDEIIRQRARELKTWRRLGMPSFSLGRSTRQEWLWLRRRRGSARGSSLWLRERLSNG